MRTIFKSKQKDLTMSFNEILNEINDISRNSISSESITCHLVDVNYFHSLRKLKHEQNLEIYFGNLLKNLKLVYRDENDREHYILLEYQYFNKYKIIESSLPYDSFQELVYSSVEQLNEAFIEYVTKLQNYLSELDEIAKYCSIVDPTRPTYKDEYRRIVIGESIWLHVEVTRSGCATNVHLIGGDNSWRKKLAKGLLDWDHDVPIYKNVMDIFDLESFPATQPFMTNATGAPKPECAICLCSELANNPPPRPFCANSRCEVYFHRSCLYQWLSTVGGSNRQRAAVRGPCPHCQTVISVESSD